MSLLHLFADMPYDQHGHGMTWGGWFGWLVMAVLAAATIAALIALTVYLIRRSRR